jgi:hypothetical protein
MDPDAEQILKELHLSFMKGNVNDEGDLLFYRINYRLADALDISKEKAELLHAEYHKSNPRKVSEGFCEFCQAVVALIPIIYGIQASEYTAMKAKEEASRLIIGDTSAIKDGVAVAMFGCNRCKRPLPRYGCL